MVLALRRAEWRRTIDALLKITAQATLLERNPVLARSIGYRSAYLDPLNHIQIELLKRHRAGDTDELALRGIHQTINGIAAGLRNRVTAPRPGASVIRASLGYGLTGQLGLVARCDMTASP